MSRRTPSSMSTAVNLRTLPLAGFLIERQWIFVTLARKPLVSMSKNVIRMVLLSNTVMCLAAQDARLEYLAFFRVIDHVLPCVVRRVVLVELVRLVVLGLRGEH